jgi:hypothetical protein
MNPSHALAAALAAMLLAGCSAATPSPAAGPAPPPEGWTAESDAGAVALWARSGCRRAAEGSAPCLERTLTRLVDQVGIAKTMEVLDTLVVHSSEARENAHALAHGLGIYAYRSPETLAATFAACPPSQQSGCYHGVIQGYFLSLLREGRDVGAEELDALCAPHAASAFLHFQCAHGMGHGLMALHGNHLPTALAACDLASASGVRESCYGGAFMENIVLVTHPHHTAAGHATAQQGDAHDDPARHAGHGGHEDHAGHAGHHAHGAMDHGPWEPLDRARPLYPCTEVEARYHDACYTMQTSAILFFNGGDVPGAARACEGAPEGMVAVCIASLGRDVVTLAEHDHGRTVELCGSLAAAAEGRAQGWCLSAAAQNLVNLAGDPGEGLAFCRAIPAAHRGACYRVVGGTIANTIVDPAERSRRCDAAEPEFVAACRSGAGLSPQAAGRP